MNENLFNKLKKLLSLSKSANIHEAEAALQKAMAMAAEAGIDLAVVSAKGEPETEKLEMIQESINTGKRLPSLQKYASWILSGHFNVKVIYSGCRYWGRSINILGDKRDVEFAKFVNDFIQEDMQRRWEYYKKSNNLSVRMKDTFMYNLWRGLDEKLTNAKKEAEQNRFAVMPESERNTVQNKYSLVLSDKKQAVDAFVRKSYPSLSSVKTRLNVFSNSTIAGDAYSIGRSMNINRPLSC